MNITQKILKYLDTEKFNFVNFYNKIRIDCKHRLV